MRLPPALLALAASLTATAAYAQPASLQRFIAEAAQAPAPSLLERYGPDDRRSGSLRLPPGRGPFPVAVLIHGGCWTKGYGSRRDMEAVGAALAARGIAVWNIEYRQAAELGGGFPGTFQDVGEAMDHLALLARRFPLDLSRIALIGHSTGAQLALWVASREKLGGRWASPARIAQVSVVAIDGPASMSAFLPFERQFCGRPVAAAFMGGTPSSVPERSIFAAADEHLPLGSLFAPKRTASQRSAEILT